MKGKLTMVALLIAIPSLAHAQYSAPSFSDRAIGERYHVELGMSFWSPTPFGTISSQQFGIDASTIDFVGDLAFAVTRFRDIDIVLRPAKKHRFRFQHTPIQYRSEVTLGRKIVFNGQNFDVTLPVNAQFTWDVWRMGYEYDFLYKKYGFVGVILEARYTQETASLQTPLVSEFNTAKAPLPAIGVIGRGYVLPDLSVTVEMTGMQLPQTLGENGKYRANYSDWNIYGTINVLNNTGLQVGWRRMTNVLKIKQDLADMKFQGLWWGAAVRF